MLHTQLSAKPVFALGCTKDGLRHSTFHFLLFLSKNLIKPASKQTQHGQRPNALTLRTRRLDAFRRINLQNQNLTWCRYHLMSSRNPNHPPSPLLWKNGINHVPRRQPSTNAANDAQDGYSAIRS